MKILFWILAILSIFVGLVVSFSCYLMHGLDLGGTIIGDVVSIVGMLAVVVSILCMVLGIVRLRKGNAKKAVFIALTGLAYSGLVYAGIFIDDVVHTILLDKSIAERNEQLYGENWDDAPAIEGIPKSYQKVLNKYYAIVRDRWPADELGDIGAVAMAEYYGDASTDNIGFALMDLNGDNINEMVIGTTAPAEGGTVIFCVYADPENPHYYINSVEGKKYYLHSGEVDGLHELEIVGTDGAWALKPVESEDLFDFEHREGAMDPAGRMTLEMIPFSQYK